MNVISLCGSVRHIYIYIQKSLFSTSKYTKKLMILKRAYNCVHIRILYIDINFGLKILIRKFNQIAVNLYFVRNRFPHFAPSALMWKENGAALLRCGRFPLIYTVGVRHTAAQYSVAFCHRLF